MAYIRKTRDEYDLITDYGYGKEVEATYTTFQEARYDLITYLNEKAQGFLPELRSVSIRHRRVKI